MSNLLIYLSLILLCIIPLSTTQSILSQNCIKHELPEKFGILTTTYIRSGSTKMFKQYLQRYAESQCSAYDNIYIIWNNEQSPQQMGVLEHKNKWKKNVYFMQTVENSLDFKYIIPTWAKQKVFFGMDDDFDITCETLHKGFQAWQQSSFGEIGPITAFYGRSFVFQPASQSFSYIDQIKLNKEWNYYHFGLTGIAFISRHFLELYYADIYQIKEMRKHVVEKFNCEDLLLNFMVSYLYPEVTPKFVELPFKSLGISGVSATKKHKSYRAQCITKFSQILGYNPVRFVRAKNDEQLMQKKTDVQQSCVVNLKQEHYEKTFIANRAYYLYIKKITGVQNAFITDENRRLAEAKKDITAFLSKRKEEMGVMSESKLELQNVHMTTKEERKMLQEDELMMHFGTEEQAKKFIAKMGMSDNQQHIKETIQLHAEQPSSIPHKEPSSPQSFKRQTPTHSENEPTLVSYQNTIYLIIFSAVMILIFCVTKLIQSRKDKYQTVSGGTGMEI